MFREPLVKAAGILALGPILASSILGYAFYQARAASDVITVTGSARETVTANHAKWVITISARTELYDQANGYALVERGVASIKKQLVAGDVSDIAVTPPNVFEQYGTNGSGVVGYLISQDVFVQSDDVKKIESLANAISEFQGDGYLARSSSVEYTYTKLDLMRVKLLSNAIEDATARANAITSVSGRNTGALKSASSGVVQVLPKNGVDISDYGSYDTQSIEKDVMVTVRAVFGIR
jgi:uncharacterized protein